MTYEAARPRYTLPFAGNEYDLVGTFELIEAVESSLKEGIVQIAVRVTDMGAAETAKLVSAMLSSSGTKTSVREAGDILSSVVGFGSDFTMLKIHLAAFLTIMLTPPDSREVVAGDMGELIGKWKSGNTASPGRSTTSFASEFSAGQRASSTKPRSGKRTEQSMATSTPRA